MNMACNVREAAWHCLLGHLHLPSHLGVDTEKVQEVHEQLHYSSIISHLCRHLPTTYSPLKLHNTFCLGLCGRFSPKELIQPLAYSLRVECRGCSEETIAEKVY